MKRGRRSFLKSAAVATVAAPVAAAGALAPVEENGLGMLYDATKCVGCKACMVACKEANDLPAEHTSPDALYDDPVELSASTKTIIKRSDGDDPTWLKAQCMHCIEPGCVSVCMIQAFYKTVDGVVAYDPARCIGCRYCQVACPFNVPKFQWDRAAPKIVKCELCRHRFPEGKGPACCEVCPREAVIFGRRKELLAEAKRRIAASPDRYVDHVYGEHEAGGTQVMVLSAVPFEETSLPQLGSEAVGSLSEAVQHGVYKGMVAPVVLYGALAGVMWRHRRLQERGETVSEALEMGGAS